MVETLIQTQTTIAKGEVFQQTLIKTPVKNPNDIILELQEDIQLTRLVSGEEVALAIGMLGGILPPGDLKETAQSEFEKGVSENNIGAVGPELLNLAIALATFQDYVAGQKVTATPRLSTSEDFDLHPRRRVASEDEIQITPLDE